MQVLDLTNFQTAVFILTTLMCFSASITVYNKSSSLINKSFAFGLINLGLSYLVSAISNLGYVLTEGSINLHDVFKTSYLFATLGMFSFMVSTRAIRFGEYLVTKKSNIIIVGVLLLINSIVIFLLEGIYYESDPLDSKTTLPFKIIVLGTIIVLYLMAFYNFLQIYKESDDDLKVFIKWFLIGWFFGGLGLLMIGISDFLRELDLIGPLLIGSALTIIVYKAFDSSTIESST